MLFHVHSLFTHCSNPKVNVGEEKKEKGKKSIQFTLYLHYNIPVELYDSEYIENHDFVVSKKSVYEQTTKQNNMRF